MNNIYLGRIVAVAMTPSGAPAALYRVSSRSFPNRVAKVFDNGMRVAILPKPGHEADVQKNPYIAYNCARIARGMLVLTNGSHTDPIAEKIAMGMPVRDALALSLLAMDYEKDQFNTPRIAAVTDPEAKVGWLATVRANGLDVRSFPLQPGSILHLSTYEHDVPLAERVSAFDADTAQDACEFVLRRGAFASFSNPVTAVAAVCTGSTCQIAIQDA